MRMKKRNENQNGQRHLPCATSRRYSKCFAVYFALVAPVVAIFRLPISSCFARDIVKERFRLVVSHGDIVFFLFLFTRSGLIARIIFFFNFCDAVNLNLERKKQIKISLAPVVSDELDVRKNPLIHRLFARTYLFWLGFFADLELG